MRRMLGRLAVVIALLGVGAVVTAAPAQAAESQCSPGQVCVWDGSGFVGCFRGMTDDGNNYATIRWLDQDACPGVINDKAGAIKNEGRVCSVLMWEHADQTGASVLLFRELDAPLPHKMADLRDLLLNNAISRHDFCPFD